MQKEMENTPPECRRMREEDTHILQSRLSAYAGEGMYPFHMPGHKRRMQPAPGLPFAWDLTEVPGTDDLHDAAGILKEAMERTADQCGADRTWYLVNGSTCGLLAGIRALAAGGSHVLCARNCHKAVYHALELSGYHVHWIVPPVDPDWGICGGISAVQVAAALRRHPSVKAVILTSPTYEGVLSDIEGICSVCHARDIPVLVDEAHGAHLMPLSRRAGFPAGALECGADVVVQSPHKTLPSLTQTALLHLQGSRVDPRRIEDELDIFETSSPSYPLMASLDGCTGILRVYGEELFRKWADRLGRFDNTVRDLRKIRILNRSGGGDGQNQKRQNMPLYDPGKILIDAAPAGMTGAELAALLRERWKMETEMTQGNLVLAMTSLCDDEEALDRLAAALVDIEAAAPKTAPKTQEKKDGDSAEICHLLSGLRPVSVCRMADVRGRETEAVPFYAAEGRICSGYLYFYPPGIPFLAPGELISAGTLKMIGTALDSGRSIYRGAKDGTLPCLRE